MDCEGRGHRVDALTAIREGRIDGYVAERIEPFRAMLACHPIKKPRSCVSLSEAFWLWAIIRDTKPAMVVESGTFEGYSWYFIDEAAPKPALRLCFDPTRKPLVGQDHWHKLDITSYDWSPMTADSASAVRRGLVFFDDHQDHRPRVEFARRIGFRDVLLHDNYARRGASHESIRFAGLPQDVIECHILPPLSGWPFSDARQPRNYRWLTWLWFKP